MTSEELAETLIKFVAPRTYNRETIIRYRFPIVRYIPKVYSNGSENVEWLYVTLLDSLSPSSWNRFQC